MTLSFAATATHELRLNEQVLLVTHELNAHQLFVKLTGQSTRRGGEVPDGFGCLSDYWEHMGRGLCVQQWSGTLTVGRIEDGASVKRYDFACEDGPSPGAMSGRLRAAA